ncbi:MAG: hypothetical protein OXC95_13390 [Dehalococcoidia bacterium]|nr:hypothetical protein [Dehalococcoidia bacterium]
MANGMDAGEMTFACLRGMRAALEPILSILLGGWLLYTYLYLFTVLVAADATLGPNAVTHTQMQFCGKVPIVVYRVVGALRWVLAFSNYVRISLLPADPLRTSVQSSTPAPLAVGWRPGACPQLK